jgi:outer membrane protein assembly factor BamB
MTTSSLARLVLLCAVALSIADSGRAADWPRFRGPNGEGISLDKDVPVKWTDKDIVFKVSIPGLGHAGPIVSKGRVFIHTSTKDGGERALLCLDASTGKTLWTKTVPAKRDHTHKFNSLASSTPAADGERVTCAFWNGKEVTLFAFDFSGKELWKYNFGSFGSQHGAGTSPMIHDGKVFFLHDQDKDRAQNPERASVLACLDAVSGKLIWEKTREAVRACYSAPFIHENGGKKELIVLTTPGITSYSPEDGKINWNFDWKFTGQRLRTVASPIMSKDLVIAVSGDGNGARHMIAIKAGGQGNLDSASLVWQVGRKGFTPYVPCVLAKDEYLFCVNDDGAAACVTAKDGKEIWRERLGSEVTASPVMIDGKVYVFGVDGDVNVFEASPKFNVLATNKVGEPISASPAVADSKLYIRTRSSLVCIGKK